MPIRITYADINLSSYRHNLDHIKSLVAPSVKIMAVIKANAYGHGIEKIAQAAAAWGAGYLGVVSVGELKRVRAAKIDTPCLLLNYLDDESVDEAINLNASFTIMDEHAIKVIQSHAKRAGKAVNIHIKVDTGMHRAGCAPVEALKLAKDVVASPWLMLEGIFTHFAESESTDASFTKHQLSVFQSCLADLNVANISPPLIHAANSAAAIVYPESHFSMIRIGILGYGLNPFNTAHSHSRYVRDNFHPIMSVKSQVIHIRQLAEGESVGYGRRWTAKRPSIIALVPIGYGDGYRRAPFHAKFALINGRKAPTVGSISMDQTVFDITDLGNVSVGDEVVLLGAQNGKQITAENLAQDYQTINYEVVTAFTDRIERKYIIN